MPTYASLLTSPLDAADPEKKLRGLKEALERCARAGQVVRYDSPQLNWWGQDVYAVVDARPYAIASKAFALELRNVDNALGRVRTELKSVLARRGVAEDLAELLLQYVDASVTTGLAVTQAVAEQAALERLSAGGMPEPGSADAAVAAAVEQAGREREARADPARGLSATEMARQLNVSDETVRNREQAGELFSFLRTGRKRGREYPVFQAWKGIAGEPLKRVLAALGRPDGATAYAFFTSPQDTLAGLSPVEALLGATGREVSPEARAFLSGPAEQRLHTVVDAAETYAATLAA